MAHRRQELALRAARRLRLGAREAFRFDEPRVRQRRARATRQLHRHREVRLVDLPGFGYAKVSKEERKGWFDFVEKYLGHRPTLKACVLIVDARRGAELDETEDRIAPLLPLRARVEAVVLYQEAAPGRYREVETFRL